MPSLPSVATVVLSQGVPADKGGRQGEGRALGQAHETMDGVRFLSSQPGALANSQHNDRYLLGPEPNVHSHPTPSMLAAFSAAGLPVNTIGEPLAGQPQC